MALVDASIVWAAAFYAYRHNNNTYIKQDSAERANRLNKETDSPPIRPNKHVAKDAIANIALLTAGDIENGKKCRTYFAGLMFKKLAGEKINGFLENAMEVSNKKEIADSDLYAIALISSLIRTFIHDVVRAEEKADRVIFAQNNKLLAEIGERINLTVTIRRCIWSNNYSVYFLTALAESGHSVRFTLKKSKEAGEVVKIKGTVRHYEDDDTICRLNRVNIIS